MNFARHITATCSQLHPLIPYPSYFSVLQSDWRAIPTALQLPPHATIGPGGTTDDCTTWSARPQHKQTPRKSSPIVPRRPVTAYHNFGAYKTPPGAPALNQTPAQSPHQAHQDTPRQSPTVGSAQKRAATEVRPNSWDYHSRQSEFGQSEAANGGCSSKHTRANGCKFITTTRSEKDGGYGSVGKEIGSNVRCSEVLL